MSFDISNAKWISGPAQLTIISTACLLSFCLAPAYTQEKNAPPIEKQYEAAVQKQNALADEQAKVINKVPGVKVQAEDLKIPAKKSAGVPNPLSWFLRPITRLQEQTIKLQQQIMRLEGPIAALQPSMLGLDHRMAGVQTDMKSMDGQLGDLQQRMGGVQQHMTNIQSQMKGMQQDIVGMRQEIVGLHKPLGELKGPIVRLHSPINELAQPVSTVGQKLTNLQAQLDDLKTLTSMVLSSIFIAALLIAVGTPVAAILVWRNRRKILPPPKPGEDEPIIVSKPVKSRPRPV